MADRVVTSASNVAKNCIPEGYIKISTIAARSITDIPMLVPKFRGNYFKRLHCYTHVPYWKKINDLSV